MAVMPSLTFPDRFELPAREEMEQFVSLLQGYLRSLGRWTDVAYTAANFMANGGTWTVGRNDQVTYQYKVQNQTMNLNAYLDTTTVVGTPSLLYLAIPGGYVAARTVQCSVPFFDNGVDAPAYARVLAGGTVVEIGRMDGAALTASTNLTYVRCMMEFEVQ